MVKILVADDEADLEVLIRQRFRKQIRENRYVFLFALNGNEALDSLGHNPDIDIVLSDINMPVMDGLTLLTRLTEVSPLIKTVMVSAYSDMENIRIAMNRGAFDFVCKPVNFTDLELTIEKTLAHVLQIKKTIQALKENNILKMYVDETVLNFMNREEFEAELMNNETIDATVLFIDICSFTSITETEPADRVVHLLNKYFDVMVKEILGNDGQVDKFIGDAVMAVFRGDNHLERAVQTAITVRRTIDKLPDEDHDLHFHPKVSIGINSGEMVSGNIGSASLRRLDYTVIGDVVNTAQRLQDAAQAGQIFINEEAWQKIKNKFECRRVGEVNLKNKNKPLVAFEVLG